MVAGAFAKPFAFNVFAYVIVGTNCSKHVLSKAEFVPKKQKPYNSDIYNNLSDKDFIQGFFTHTLSTLQHKIDLI